MKTRSERDSELRLQAAVGGFQLAQVVGLFLDARDASGQLDSLDTEQMIQVILAFEESTGAILPDSQPTPAKQPASHSAN
jgi:hypothetical protein